MVAVAADDLYEIVLIDNEADACLCAELISKAFVSNNPLTIFNQTKTEILFNDWLWPIMQDALDERLSFMLRHRPTHEIVAAIIATDLYLYCEKHPCDESNPTSNDATVDLFDEMLTQFVKHDFGEQLKMNTVLFIGAVGIRPDYLGKGLMTRLNTHVCEYARRTKGFQYVFAQTMHPAMRHIYTEKMHGKLTQVVDLATWLWKKKDNGTTCPLKNYTGESAANVLVSLSELNS